MEIKTLKDLLDFTASLCDPVLQMNPEALSKLEVVFTDRFNEYEVDDVILGVDNNIIQISCRKKGSALEGFHRVMGKDK